MLLEPAVPGFCHHFPYRNERATRRRLEHLVGTASGLDRTAGDPAASRHMWIRSRTLDAVYRRQWDSVRYFPPCVAGYHPILLPWKGWVNEQDSRVVRWYTR